MASLRLQGRVSLCRFIFADGRQCRTLRAGRHPHFRPFHVPELSVLCVSAQLRDNRFPSFLPLCFLPVQARTPSLTHLNATFTNHPASVDSKPLI